MPNLLGEEDKKLVRTEYCRRLITVLLGEFLAILIISLFILVPLLINISAVSRNTKIELGVIKSRPASSDYRDLEKSIEETKRAVDILRADISQRQHISDNLVRALEGKPKGVSIENIVWTNEELNIRIVLNGIAESRESLREYVSNLQSDKSFAAVNIPVSAFAKAEDADFSITLRVSKTAK